MSNVLQPRGPLPARVYWVRRLLLLAVFVAMVGSIGLAVSAVGDDGGGGTAPTSAGDTTSTPESDPDASTPTTSSATGATADRGQVRAKDDQPASTGDKPAGGKGADAREGVARGGGASADNGGQPTATPLPEPTGACDPADVSIGIDVADSPSGKPNKATLSFTSTTVAACTIGLTSDTLEIQVTSGDDVVWSSADCPALLSARQVVARVDPPARYTFTWSGHRSTQSCGGQGDPAEAGGYYVNAALIGGEPARAYFDVT